MGMTYLSFLRQYFPFLLFGFLMMGTGNFGQTFFIALYSEELRSFYGLSNAGFGGLYSAMTLMSALVMVYSGQFIDSWKLPVFAGATLLGLAVSCALMGIANHIIVLAIALFGLRHFGQGLSVHTGMTAVGRSFDAQRGRAVSIVQLGYASFEGIFPLMALAIMTQIDWQQSWLAYALVITVLVLPLQLYLVRHEPAMTNPETTDAAKISSSRAEVLRDKRFYMLLPLYLSSPFLLTGMFFHQVLLAGERGWALSDLAAAFSLYAACKVIVSLLAGPWIDRFTALRLMPLAAVPVMLAFTLLCLAPDLFGAFTPFVYMGLIGIHLGFAGPISGGVWPELFGTRHLGAIRSMTSPIVITGTAAAPVLFGLAIDAGIGFTHLSGFGLIFIVAAAILAFLVPRDKLAVS